MINSIAHVGLLVTDLDQSVSFYRDQLGLEYRGEMKMTGSESDKLFGIKGVEARVAYLAPGRETKGPLLELIQFEQAELNERQADFKHPAIAEVCFETEDIDKKYEQMKESGVEFLSAPQTFDYTSQNMGRSRAVYFRDPDGIIQELLQTDI